jgi:hypothetical protein
MAMIWDAGIWIQAILYVFVWSLAIPGENRFYRFAEYTLIGVTAGYAMVQGIKTIIDTSFQPVLTGQIYMIIPIVLGFSVYLLYTKNYKYVSRWPMALMIGSGIGVTIRAIPRVRIIEQVTASFLPILGVDPFTAFSNLVLIVSTVVTLFYFFTTIEHKGNYGKVTKFGRYIIMILLGANWGSQIMMRSTMFIGNMSFMIRDFLFVLLGIS